MEKRIAELEARLKDARKAIQEKEAELEARSEALVEARGRVDRERDEAERARKEADELRTKVTSSDRDRDEAERARKEAERARDDLRSKVIAVEEERDVAAARARREADELRSKVTSLERERDDLKSRSGTGTADKDASVMKSLERFIEEQTRMMSVHARAMTVQNFPPLPRFTGEEIDCEDKSFERWCERFEERAALAGWDDKQKLHQLKFQLDKTALRVFEVMLSQSVQCMHQP